MYKFSITASFCFWGNGKPAVRQLIPVPCKLSEVLKGGNLFKTIVTRSLTILF